jgi:hypothetical protein
MTDRTPAEIYDELFDAWVKQGPRAIESLIEDRPADFLLALIEAMWIDREGHTLQ